MPLPMRPSDYTDTDRWRPIESAPKDGSLIDVWVVTPARDKKGPPTSRRVVDVFWEKAEEPWEGGRWAHRTSLSDWEPTSVLVNYTFGPERITHWMAAPIPPSDEKA